MSGRPGGKPRRNPGVKGRRPDLKELRRKEAFERQEAYGKKLAVDVIAQLDLKFGKDQGARKQRAKLAKRRVQKEWAQEPAKPGETPRKFVGGAVKPEPKKP